MNHELTEIRNLWACACAHDKINPDSPFVTFSKGNPWTELLFKCTANPNEQSRTKQPNPTDHLK